LYDMKQIAATIKKKTIYREKITVLSPALFPVPSSIPAVLANTLIVVFENRVY